MVFNENSGLVKIWVKNIRSGKKTLADVPDICNLKEVVIAVLEAD